MHRRASVVVLAVLGVAACSSGSDPSSTDSIPSATVADDAGSSVPPETDVADSDGAPTGGSDEDFCAAISAIQAAEFELEETFGPDARALFGAVQAAAPSDISDDVATVIAALDELAALGISADTEDPVAFDAASEILLDPAFTEANTNLEEYTAESCGIDLGAGSEADVDLGELSDVGDA